MRFFIADNPGDGAERSMLKQGQKVQPTPGQRQTQHNLQKLEAKAQTCSVMPKPKKDI